MNPPSPTSAVPPVKHDPLDWARQTGEADALLEEIKAQLRAKQRRRKKIAAIATTAGCLAFLVFWVVPFVRQTSAVSTVVAQRATLALADGSRAELNAATRVHTDFRYGRRVVQLQQGEAFFSVRRDQAHPFLVETPHGTVRVTGTKFNVRLDAGERPVVTLVEGAIAVEDVSAAPVRLAPGEQLSLADGTPRVRALSAAEVENVTAWREGRIVLEGLTLAEAAARFATYHGRVIVVAPAIAGVRMGGNCPLDDLDNFLAGVEEALTVKVTRRDDGSFFIGPR